MLLPSGAWAVSAPAVQLSDLDRRWEQFTSAEDGSAEELLALDNVERTMLELGVRNLPAHALVLLQSADEALTVDNPVRAERLQEFAERLAPESPQPAFFKAKLEWTMSPANAGPVYISLRTAYASMSSSLAGTAAVSILWRVIAARSIMLFSLLLALALALRYLAPLAMDVRLLSQRTLTLAQGRSLVLLLVAGGSLVFWSPFLAVMATLVATSISLRWSERLFALATVVGLSFLPRLAVDNARLIAVNEFEASRSIMAITAPCDERCLNALERRVEEDPHAALALATVLYRRGGSQNVARSVQLIEALDVSQSAEASLLTLRGNLAFVAGEIVEADALYGEAERVAVTNGQRAAAALNQYRVNSAQGRTTAASRSLERAIAADEPMVEPHIAYDADSQNVVLAIAPIPAASFVEELLRGSSDPTVQAAATEMLSPWYGAVSPRLTIFLSAVVATLLIVGVFFYVRRVGSKRCERCGHPTSRSILAEAYVKRVCVLCYQLGAMPAALTFEQRRARESRIVRWDRLTSVGAPALDLVCPGVGHVAQGRSWLGGFLLALSVLAFSLWTADATPLSIPYSLGEGDLFDGRTQAAILLFMIAFVFANLTRLLLRRSS